MQATLLLAPFVSATVDLYNMGVLDLNDSILQKQWSRGHFPEKSYVWKQ